MIIADLEIDGFGVWTRLPLGPFSEGLNVIYGPNEAGKTTVMQFVRSALYGFSEERRRRYLPPVHGGRPGGAIALESDGRRFRLERRLDEANGHAAETLALSDDSGQSLAPDALAALLGGVDEAIYNNVFAVGLREMQELGTLSDTEASRLLYDLTTGLDRVSLGDVLRDLAESRRALLAEEGQSSELSRLVAQRRRLRRERDDLKSLTGEYGRLARERTQLLPDIERLERQRGQWERETRVVETANLLREKWHERESLDRQLAAVGELRSLPDRVSERLGAIDRRLGQVRRRSKNLARSRRAAREEAAGLGVNEALWRQAPRIAALLDQQQWLGTLERQVQQVDVEITRLQTELDTHRRGAGLVREGTAQPLPPLSRRTVAELRPLARSIHDCRRRFEEARREAAAQESAAAALTQQAQTATTAAAAPDLPTAVEQAGEAVAQLRRRVQLDRRLEQMALQETELAERAQELLDRQVLPVWALVALGGVFVLGVVLILTGLFMKSLVGSVGWAMGVLGLAGTIAAVAAKYLLERSAERQLAACEKQTDMLRLQIRQAKDERDELDGLLPVGGGPLTVRLEVAERRLAELQELLPLETRTKAARQDNDNAHERAAQAKRAWIEAHRRWTTALTQSGWPGKLSPREVRQAVRGSRKLRDLERQVERLRQEREHAEQSRRNLALRVEQLLAEARLPTAGVASQQLQGLRQELSQQDALVARRQELAARARRLNRKKSRCQRQIRLLRRRRRALLRRAGVVDAGELQRVSHLHEQAAQLRAQREAAEREIKAALPGGVAEDEVRGELTAHPAAALEARWEELAGRLQACEAELRERFERRGQLNQLLASLAADRRPAIKQLELAQVETRLRTAIERWQVLAATGAALDSVRAFYERERQPETLREASSHLQKLTQGRYRRVWTPIDADALFVDDAEGRSLPIEVLSQGTREQLFLSLRLALAGVYARRGAGLPLVLDDVFVNFDAERAKAAVALLIEYAGAGHQVLAFTCHEHIVKLFKNRKAAVLELPSRAAPAPQRATAKSAGRRSRKAIAAPPPLAPAAVAKPTSIEEPAIEESQVEEAAQTEAAAVEDSSPPPVSEFRELPSASPIIEVPTPPAADAQEAIAAEMDPPRAPAAVPPVPPSPGPRRVRAAPARAKATAWRDFLGGGGAEEFDGEFAERPGPEERRPDEQPPDRSADRRPSVRDRFEDVWLSVEDDEPRAFESSDDAEAA